MEPTKAQIIAIDPPGTTFTFQFNPTKYSVSKSLEWHFQGQKGSDVPAIEFVQGKGKTVSIELFLDGLEQKRDISEQVKELEKFTTVNPKNVGDAAKPRPPRVRFHWGGVADFKAVINSLNVSYTMFHSDGKPARGTVSLTLQEIPKVEEKKAQNPTSLGDVGLRSHRVVAGETLDLIAYQELGAAKHWRYIAETNKIHNPLSIKPGQYLVIAALP